MKKAIKEARNEFKFTNDINDKIRVKKCKKEFRKVQRRNMFMYENNRNKNIESLFRISNKEEFWKAFNSCKESDTHIDNVSCKIDSNKDNKRCFDHFNRLFNRNFEDNLFNEQQKEIIREVNLWKERCKNNFSTNDKNYVSSNMIVQCINEMKPSNSAGYDGITNNMLKKSMSDRLICVLKDFINAILCTGVIPENFNRSIIIPIIKDKSKKVFDVNNLRPISVSNCLSQLLERIILYKSKFLNDSSTNQFGFQLGLSTYQPIFLLKETVNKYKRTKSPLYIASLDAEKAYDSLWRTGLFYKLKDKMDENLWLILMSYYEKSDGIIKFNDTIFKDVIKINNGVKQGGVLSPSLFNFFINDLIEQVINEDGGCKIGNIKTSILAYCDDLILLSTSLKKLENLVGKCVEYSQMWMFKFNPNKSLIMNCGFKLYENDQIEIKIGGKLLETKDTCKYLGLILNETNDGNIMILDRFNLVRKSFFSLNSFGMKPVGVNPFIKSFIYNTFCLPKLTYGMGLYALKRETLNLLNVSQNNLVRYMLGIPYRSHISDINKVLNIVSIEYLYYCQICIVIKLLHRHKYTKEILLTIEGDNEFHLDLNNDIEKIASILNIEKNFIIFYPDRTRKLILDQYYYNNVNEGRMIEISNIFQQYSFADKRRLKCIVKMNF